MRNNQLQSLPPLTDQQEAQIQRQIASDPDSPELTDEQLAQGKPFAEVFPDLMASVERARIAEKRLQEISIKLEPEVIAKFKATGDGWQGRINEVLKQAKVG